jgi:hypothetical protein
VRVRPVGASVSRQRLLLEDVPLLVEPVEPVPEDPLLPVSEPVLVPLLPDDDPVPDASLPERGRDERHWPNSSENFLYRS